MHVQARECANTAQTVGSLQLTKLGTPRTTHCIHVISGVFASTHVLFGKFRNVLHLISAPKFRNMVHFWNRSTPPRLPQFRSPALEFLNSGAQSWHSGMQWGLEFRNSCVNSGNRASLSLYCHTSLYTGSWRNVAKFLSLLPLDFHCMRTPRACAREPETRTE